MTSSRWSSRTAYSHVYYHSQSSRYHSQTVAAGAPAERPLSVKDLPRANNTKDRDTWPTRQSLGTPHIYKHMVKMYSAGVDGHQMSGPGIMLSHTAASSEEGIQSQLPTSPLARWSRRPDVIAPYEGAGESVHAQYSCNALVAASWRLYW